MTEVAWRELGYATGTTDWITGHGRLLRSLHWGDDDYSQHVLSAAEYFCTDQERLESLLAFDGVEAWLREWFPQEHAALYDGSLAVGEALERARQAGAALDLEPEIRRIHAALNTDAALALGSTKELVEAVLKRILELHGAIRREHFPDLLSQAMERLRVHPARVDVTAPGAEDLRRLLG